MLLVVSSILDKSKLGSTVPPSLPDDLSKSITFNSSKGAKDFAASFALLAVLAIEDAIAFANMFTPVNTYATFCIPLNKEYTKFTKYSITGDNAEPTANFK